MSNLYSIKTTDRIPTAQGIRNYPANRKPLQGNPLQKLPLGSIKPGGWIKEQLTLMRDGMTGRLSELSGFLTPDSRWLDIGNHEEAKFDEQLIQKNLSLTQGKTEYSEEYIKASNDLEILRNGGASAWEELPYWLRGYYDLGIILDDEKLKAEAKKWVEAAISSLDNDGYFGPPANKSVDNENKRTIPDLWPNMLMLDTLRSYYEHSADQRVITLMLSFFKWCLSLDDQSFMPDIDYVKEYLETDPAYRDKYFAKARASFQKSRAGDMLPHIYWLYNRTGEEWLLELTTRFKEKVNTPEGEWLDGHNVNFTQKFRIAANYSIQSGNPADLAETEYWYNKHMAAWGQQPGGIFAGDERVRDGKTDPRQAIETCGMVEFAKSFYILSEITGDPVYADRCEDILFNSFPAAQTPDLKALHYLTAANQPQLDAGFNHEHENHGYPQIYYSPWTYRCCQHNVAMGWPYYSEHLWMAADGDGLAAWLYGDSDVTALVGEGVKVTIQEKTGYPFDTAVSMTILPEKTVMFPLYLRIPGWAQGCVLKLNGEVIYEGQEPGKFLVLEQNWQKGDLVTISFQMQISIKRWEKSANSLTVYRGPLSYSLRIEEDWRRLGGTDTWPDWEVYPKTPWNYGLVIDQADPDGGIRVKTTRPAEGQPWTISNAPVELAAKGRRIPAWQLDDNQTVDELQKSPVKSSEPLEDITLIPMGCARLRISCFPEIGDGPDANEWK